MVGYFGYNYPGLLWALVVVPMLVQSCLDAFLAAVWKLRTAFAPLPESCCAAVSSFGPRAVRPQRPYRLVVRYVPRPTCRTTRESSLLQGPRALRLSINILRRPRAESLPFVLLHCYTTTSLQDCFYVFVLIGNLTSVRSLT